ncbi:MAG: SpoIIE family protein phosphatase [Gemmatimonadales bacterium]|nr:SpoIIE family protein phosphatase [Gemmatimonadales bacterium]
MKDRENHVPKLSVATSPPDFREMLDNLYEGIWSIDKDGYTNYVNPRMEKILGFSRDEILGQHLFQFMDDQAVEQCRNNLDRRRQGISESHDFELRGKDGQLVPTLMHTSPILDNDGNYAGALAAVVKIPGNNQIERELINDRDNLKRRVADQSSELASVAEKLQAEIADKNLVEGMFRKLLEAAPDAMVVADQAGDIILVNAVTEKLFGYSRNELLGRKVEILVPAGAREQHVGHRHDYEHNPHRRPMGSGIEVAGRRKDSSIFPAEVSLGPLEVEGRRMVFSVIRDISERKRVEDDARKSLNLQLAIAAILQASVEAVSVEEFLQQTLDLLLDMPWLVLQSKGAIFLSEDGSDVLVMKAKKGLSESLLADCSKVPFGHCLCGQAAASRRIIFSDCVDERHVTRYEGMTPHGHYCVPIESGDRLYGVINLYVQEGHKPTSDEDAFLNSVAKVLAGTIKRKMAEEDLQEKNTQLRAAQKIQEHLLPRSAPDIPGWDIAGAYEPAEFAAGDHYDFFRMGGESLGLVVGDVSGHGFSSALLMASTHAYLRSWSEMGMGLKEIFQRGNSVLFQETETSNFITAIMCRVDLVSRRLEYVSAGHPDGLVLNSDGEIKAHLTSTGMPIAVLPEAEFKVVQDIQLETGDTILLLTDGILESTSPEEDFFGLERTLATVRSFLDQPAAHIAESLCRAAAKFHGSSQQEDDLTAVVIKVLPN